MANSNHLTNIVQFSIVSESFKQQKQVHHCVHEVVFSVTTFSVITCQCAMTLHPSELDCFTKLQTPKTMGNPHISFLVGSTSAPSPVTPQLDQILPIFLLDLGMPQSTQT